VGLTRVNDEGHTKLYFIENEFLNEIIYQVKHLDYSKLDQYIVKYFPRMILKNFIENFSKETILGYFFLPPNRLTGMTICPGYVRLIGLMGN